MIHYATVNETGSPFFKQLERVLRRGHSRVDQDVLYTTSTQNEVGRSIICRIFLEKGNMKVCGSIQGHGWRIINQNEDYIVAGSGESKLMRFQKRIG